MNLYKKICELETDKDSFYYNDKYGLRYIKPISNSNKAWTFIEEYFKAGAKEEVLIDDNIKKLKRKGKNTHTVVMYFLGILSRNLFEKKIEKQLDKLLIEHNSEFNYRYEYTWFLTCLFHDYAWIHENKNFINKDYLNHNFCFKESLLTEFDIKYNLFNHEIKKGNDFETHYDEEIIKKYFYYRYKNNKLDHGIIGGMLLFDRLKKNYKEKWNEYRKDNKEENNYFNSNYTYDYDCFELKGKTWRRDHLDHYAYISDCIISHNIWFGKGKYIPKYKNYGLDELIESNAEKVSINNNPLLFMLGIIDTIEPIKFFEKFNPKEVLKNISIVIRNNEINIRVFPIEPDSSKFNYYKWFKKIKSMEDWLDLSININQTKLEIFF